MKSIFKSLVFVLLISSQFSFASECINQLSDVQKSDADVVYSNFEIPTEHPKEVLDQAKQLLERGLQEEDYQNRLDLRDVEFITIDGAETVDRDDAIYVKMLENGNYQLNVAVPHVTHFISPSSAIGKWYFSQSTSHYLREKVFHLLPLDLVSGLLSIDPDVDRMAMVYQVEVNAKTGQMSNFKVDKAVVRSKGAYTYKSIQEKMDSPETQTPHEKLYIDLYKLLNKTRKSTMAFPYITEKRPKYDNNDNIVDFVDYEMNTANHLIEVFMVTINSQGAEYMRRNEIPGIYRGQEETSVKKIKSFLEALNKVGFQIQYSKKLSAFENLQKTFDRMKKHDRPEVITPLLFYVTNLAKNTSSAFNHFFLNVEKYAFHTSPLRRVSDYWNQYMYDHYLEGNLNSKEVNSLLEQQSAVIEKDNQNMLNAKRSETQWQNIKRLKIIGDEAMGQSYYSIIIREYEESTMVYVPDLKMYGTIKKAEFEIPKKPFAKLNKKTDVTVVEMDKETGELVVVPTAELKKANKK